MGLLQPPEFILAKDRPRALIAIVEQEDQHGFHAKIEIPTLNFSVEKEDIPTRGMATAWAEWQYEVRTNPDLKVTIEVDARDAYAVAMGPLDYTVAAQEGKVPEGGSPFRVRQALARALGIL